MRTTKKAERENNTGRYKFTVDRLCACGHSLDNHTADRGRGPDGKMCQPCIICDTTGEECDCDCFKPAKKVSK